MTRHMDWCFIFVVVFQCLGSIYSASENSDNGQDCSLHGPTVTFEGQLGPKAGPTTEGHLEWLDEESGEETTCKLNVKTVKAEGAYHYEVSVTLPQCAPHCNPHLRLDTKLHCASLPLDSLNVQESDGTTLFVPIWFFNSCHHGNRHTRSVIEKREWAGDDMQWLKRSALNGWKDRPDTSPFGYNKKFDTHTMNWLRKRSPEYPWMQKKPTWNSGGVNWLKKRAWSKANTEWLKRGWGNDADMNWLKRGWSYGDAQWLRKRSEPEYDLYEPEKRWDHGEIMDWLKKRSIDDEMYNTGLDKRAWENANTEWIKRDMDMHHAYRIKRDTFQQEEELDLKKRTISDDNKMDKKNWGASGMSWIKRDQEKDKKNWGGSGMSWIKRDQEKDKKNWGGSGMSWIKRDQEKDKKNWGGSGMSWIKRGDDKRNWGASGMSWIKRSDDDEKRNWGASGMSWIKRNPEQEKRNWGASGMSWIKRDGDEDQKRNWGGSGMSWIKRDRDEDQKRNWGASGMSWIKRDDGEDNKRNWGGSGMSWIKRGDGEDNKRNWGASGMSWIKRDGDEDQKRNWGGSGMSWIKRDGDEDQKRNWGGSGMSWIKRGDGKDKRNWGGSGMSWIKRDGDEDQKRNWGGSGMSWIKRDGEDNKRNWGASGMSWIKRSPENVAFAQKTLSKMINDKIVPPVHTRSWPRESDWLKRSYPDERRAWGVEKPTWNKRDTSSLAINDLGSNAHSSVNKVKADVKEMKPENDSETVSGSVPGMSSSSLASDNSATAH